MTSATEKITRDSRTGICYWRPIFHLDYIGETTEYGTPPQDFVRLTYNWQHLEGDKHITTIYLHKDDVHKLPILLESWNKTPGNKNGAIWRYTMTDNEDTSR